MNVLHIGVYTYMVYDDDINFLPLTHLEKSPFHIKRPNNRTNKQVSLESFILVSVTVPARNEQNNYGCTNITTSYWYFNYLFTFNLFCWFYLKKTPSPSLWVNGPGSTHCIVVYFFKKKMGPTEQVCVGAREFIINNNMYLKYTS